MVLLTIYLTISEVDLMGRDITIVFSRYFIIKRANQLLKILYYRFSGIFLFDLIVIKLFILDHSLKSIGKLQITRLFNWLQLIKLNFLY